MNRKPRTLRTLATLSAMLAICAAAGPGAAAVDFLIPGVSIESVALVAGARVSYLVTTESFGATDSSYVELRVLDHARGSFHLEIVSAPYPRTAEGSTTVRLRLADRFTAAATPEELRACISEIRVREGAGSFREPSTSELDDLDLERLFVRPDDRATRTSLGSARIATAAGAFECEGVKLSRAETKQVVLGGVQAERGEEETSLVWRSPRVPLWGVVKSVVEKKTWTASSVARMQAEPRHTKTQSVLLSYRSPRGGA